MSLKDLLYELHCHRPDLVGNPYKSTTEPKYEAPSSRRMFLSTTSPADIPEYIGRKRMYVIMDNGKRISTGHYKSIVREELLDSLTYLTLRQRRWYDDIRLSKAGFIFGKPVIDICLNAIWSSFTILLRRESDEEEEVIDLVRKLAIKIGWSVRIHQHYRSSSKR